MKDLTKYQWRKLMFPGLKRWVLIILVGITVIVYGVFLLLGYHPVHVTSVLLKEMLEEAANILPYRISGIIVIVCGGLVVFIAAFKMMLSVVHAYTGQDRESIPDVLYRKRHLDKGPKVAVIGGGTGLSNLLKGLKRYTNNITAIVTVGDDGGSSGRLRQELGVLPPGDIRNCITALADEEKLVTELFRYRFEHGEGLEGHSFGNLFISAVCAITNGDMLEATRVASRVLNSCGQVLPSSLTGMTLVAEMADGSTIKGESQIPKADGKIARVHCEPNCPAACAEALEAILDADLIILGPGSLYTSIIPNLLIQGIPEAIRNSSADKIYVCNVMTQKGETTDYSVSDHVEALLNHSGTPCDQGFKLVEAVLINDQLPSVDSNYPARPVRFDPERLKEFGVFPVRRPLVSQNAAGHHDPEKLAKVVMLWFIRQGRRPRTPPPAKTAAEPSNSSPPPKQRAASFM